MVTFVRFLSTVNSAVIHKVTWLCESFATNSTFKRLLSWMTSPVYCQGTATVTTFATFRALVLAGVNIHVFLQGALRWQTFLTVRTTTRAICLLTTGMNIQISSVGFSCSLQRRAPVSDITVSPCTTTQGTLLLLHCTSLHTTATTTIAV